MEPLKTPMQHCLAAVMVAKDKIFRAQDAAVLINDATTRAAARRVLDRVRSDLEDLDWLIRSKKDW